MLSAPGHFDRAIAICTVRRLGSLMDLSPFMDGVINNFGQRTVLALRRRPLPSFPERTLETFADSSRHSVFRPFE